jgi:hypothetical protein
MEQLDFQPTLAFFEHHKELLTIVLAAIGGAWALGRYWRDQSWKNKQFAYEYAESVFRDPRTMTALRMLDWSKGRIPKSLAEEYGLRDNSTWTAEEVGLALRPHDPAVGQTPEASPDESPDSDDDATTQGGAKEGRFSPKEFLIRELFDDCLARFERLGNFMKARVISKEDFRSTLAYYPKIMAEPRLNDIREPLRNY